MQGLLSKMLWSFVDVHANLFKNAVQGVEVADADHLVILFKSLNRENLAPSCSYDAGPPLVRQLWDDWGSWDDSGDSYGACYVSWVWWVNLTGITVVRKSWCFRLWKEYKGMIPHQKWCGRDDQIREPLRKLLDVAKKSLDSQYSKVKRATLKPLRKNLRGMIFKEESILLMISCWRPLPRTTGLHCEESDAYEPCHYLPAEKWAPKRLDFKEEGSKESEGSTEPLSSNGEEHPSGSYETPEVKWRKRL